MARVVADHRALLERDGRGWAGWRHSAPPGATVAVTYAFVEPDDLPAREDVFYAPRSVHALTAAQRADARRAFEAFDRLSGLDLVEASGDAMIEIFAMSGSLVAGYAFVPRLTLTDVEIVVDAPRGASVAPGTVAFETLLHEIGHALGLKHPFDGDPTLRRDLDHTGNTVMSYTPRGGPAAAPGPLDAAALRALYGPERPPAAGGTVARWDEAAAALVVAGGAGPDRIVASQRTIVDAGPGNDEIWCLSGRVSVDAGEGDDVVRLLGPGATVAAGPGADRVWLGEGAAGAGPPSLHGGPGFDTMVVGRPGDGAAGGAAWSLRAVAGVEALAGGSGDDRLESRAAGGRLRGGPGADVLAGLGGADTLAGGCGADTLTGGGGADRLAGGEGADLFVWRRAGESAPGAARRDVVAGVGPGDRLDLSAIDARPGRPGDDAFAPVAAGGAFVEGALRLRQVAGGLLLEAQLDGDAAAEFAVLIAGARAVAAEALIL